MRWHSLYAEARLEILDFVANSTIHENGSIARYACVSREWQDWFEIFTFRRVEVSTSDILPFINTFMINPRRRKYLQCIGVRLDLPTHKHIQHPFLDRDNKFLNINQQMHALAQKSSTLYGNSPWLRLQEEENNRAFTMILRGLFMELFQWRREDCHHAGIELEIIADAKSHWQKTAGEYRALNPPTDAGNGDFYNSLSSDLQVFHAPPYHGHKVIHDGELDFHIWLELDVPMGGKLGPEVHVISGLSILRRNVRHFDPYAIAHVVSLLPRLREFKWEVRPHARWETEHKFHRHLRVLLSAFSPAMTKIRIQQQPTSKPLNSTGPSEHLPGLGRRLILACPFLTNIYLDISVDATRFFRTWAYLQNVQNVCVRTNQALFDEAPNSSNHLFGWIGEAVSNMSTLRALCVFNKVDSVACTVNCLVERESFKVIAHCSWPFDVRDDTKACWRKSGGQQSDEGVWLLVQSSYDTVQREIILQQRWHSSLC
ncbi:hypothetical protein FANTH_8170 [Fusarium anthophilum]|uniref:DUF6546 domain-containing protein n=1 Tax=Fusarium anthophilum TaxID=48485 RepID=A0A8H5E1W9_9HYPO|nr:hypothetical protein FANTH_8170 [Fusarium anthophilum]